jgi:hypothetical protein
MTECPPRKPLTFAFHPTARGFGWVAFEGPFTPFDWGISYSEGANAVALQRLDTMLKRLLPDTLVIESFDAPSSKRSERVVRLCKGAVALAADRGLEVAIYTRDQIRACFAHVGARTRYEIAAAVARHVDALSHNLPKARKAWECEPPRIAQFSAAALVLTHFQYDARKLLDGLI